MGATTYLYDYIKSEDTYTLDQYIECQSDDNACYKYGRRRNNKAYKLFGVHNLLLGL